MQLNRPFARKRPQRVIAASAILLTVGALAAAAPRAQTPNSLLDGAYTNAQADRGFTQFMKTCSRCHGADMQGQEAPPLSGTAFMSRWQGRNVGELFEHTLEFMPADQPPRSLDPQSVADLLAYVLQFNGYPSGAAELPANPSTLRAMRLDPLPRRSQAPGAQVVDH